jgi:hypothetical protein
MKEKRNQSTIMASGKKLLFVLFSDFSPCWNEEFTLTTWFTELSMLEVLVYDKDVGTKVNPTLSPLAYVF